MPLPVCRSMLASITWLRVPVAWQGCSWWAAPCCRGCVMSCSHRSSMPAAGAVTRAGFSRRHVPGTSGHFQQNGSDRSDLCGMANLTRSQLAPVGPKKEPRQSGCLLRAFVSGLDHSMPQSGVPEKVTLRWSKLGHFPLVCIGKMPKNSILLWMRPTSYLYSESYIYYDSLSIYIIYIWYIYSYISYIQSHFSYFSDLVESSPASHKKTFIIDHDTCQKKGAWAPHPCLIGKGSP